MSLIITPRQFTQRAELYHQLAQLTAAGIGVLPALERLRKNPPARSFRKSIQQLLDELAKGRTFTESLKSASGWLPVFDIALIEAGERSGRLDNCFRLLADYYNDRARVTKQVISQLIYPVGLVHFAALVFLIVLPFASSQFNASLLFLFAKALLILSPLYLGTALLIYAMQSKHGEKWRSLMESLLQFIPILGAARRCLALSRLAAALEALINAGVNIIEAWDLAAAASGSPALRRAVEKWKPEIEAGRTPAEVLNESRQFPEMFANFYASGEVSGKLDDALKRLYTYYQEEGTRKLHAFAQWTPRLVYFLVMLIIAFKIIQFYTGYFNQVSTIMNGF
jgi:type II secretory pathway component PulF